MGYLMSAFLVENRPSETALRRALPGHGYRVYAVGGWRGAVVHTWACPGGPGYFFCDTPRDHFDASIPVPSQWSSGFDRLAQAFDWLSRDVSTYGLGWTQLALALALNVEGEVFFFAADDDLIDSAVHVLPDGVLRFCADFGDAEVSFDGDRLSVTRVVPLDEDETIAKPIAKLPKDWYSVTEPRFSDGGKVLHSSPLKLWPSWAPPGSALGLGGDVPDDRDDTLRLIADGKCTS